MSSNKKRKAEHTLQNLFHHPRLLNESSRPTRKNSSVYANLSHNNPSSSVGPTDIPSTSSSSRMVPVGHPSQPGTSVLPVSTPTQRNIQKSTWSGLDKFVRLALKLSAGMLGQLKIVTHDVGKLAEVFEAASKSEEEHIKLHDELNALMHQFCEYFGEDGSPEITPSIINLIKGIEQEILFVLQKRHRTALSSLTGATSDAEEIVESQRRIGRLLQRLELNANVKIWGNIEEMTTRDRLRNLPISPEAKHNSTASANLRRGKCTANTRSALLEDLEAWSRNQANESIYWLNGMAGTGKTTVAYSLCENLKHTQKLAASFFCSRQLPWCRDVNRIIPTICHQLALFSQPFQQVISSALGKDPDLHNQELPGQFKSLILDPLHKVKNALPTDLVIVIDALDECDDGEGVGLILDILLSHAQHLPIKFFVASRPDARILDQVRGQDGNRVITELRLHELDRSIVQDDIRRYLTSKLDSRMQISLENIKTLTEKSGALFIYAATVVRYIESGGLARSTRRLEELLGAYRVGASSTSSEKDMDALYTTILELAINNEGLNEDDRKEIMLVLHTIICAWEPPSIGCLAGLLQLDSERSIRPALKSLLSVLQESDITGIVNTFHESFSDYLFDKSRSGNFYCDKKEHHARMARLCFAQINLVNPSFNICDLASSYTLDEEVSDLDVRTENLIPGSLFYACQYWGAHLKSVGGSEECANLLFTFLSTRLLLWMEVMNLKKCISDAVRELHGVREWFNNGQPIYENIQQLLQDAWEFTTAFSSSQVQLSTPHIYVSHLSLWPEHRPVARCYQPKELGLIAKWSTAMSIRQAIPISTFDTRQKGLCLACSPIDSRVVYGSESGVIHIWDAHTGQTFGQPLEGHTSRISSVVYSSDGAYIVSGSWDKTIRIWNANTCLATGTPLKGHTDFVTSVACSPDGAHIASGSHDKTIRIWDVYTQKLVGQPLKGHTHTVDSVAYSPDSAFIVSSARDRSARIWDTRNGQQVGQPLKGHTKSISSAVFSPNGAYVITGSEDKTIRIWDAHTGNPVGLPLKGHTAAVSSVAYSPDSLYLASGSFDGTVRTCDSCTGNLVGQPMDGGVGAIISVAYSSDGAYIVSGSLDKAICVWDARVKPIAHELNGSTCGDLPIAYPPNDALIAPSLHDGAVNNWHVYTGQPPKGHIKSISTYSPNHAQIAFGSDEAARIWDAPVSKPFGQSSEGHISHGKSAVHSQGHADIVSNPWDNTTRTWGENANMPVENPLEGDTSFASSVECSPNGAYMASGPRDTVARIWDVCAGQPTIQPQRGHIDSVRSVSSSPDGAYIVSCSTDKSIRIWEARTGKPVGEPLKGHTESVSSVAYSQDGEYIISRSWDKTIRIWRSEFQMLDLPRQLQNDRAITAATFGSNSRFKYADLHVCCSNCQVNGPHEAWSLNDEGWIVAGASKRLAWIPPDLRNTLLYPRNVELISARGTLQLEFHANGVNKVGEHWSEHFQPQNIVIRM